MHLHSQAWRPGQDPAVTLSTTRERDWADQLAEANRMNAELRAAVLTAESGVVDTGSYEIIHLDRVAWDRIVTLAKGGK